MPLSWHSAVLVSTPLTVPAALNPPLSDGPMVVLKAKLTVQSSKPKPCHTQPIITWSTGPQFF